MWTVQKKAVGMCRGGHFGKSLGYTRIGSLRKFGLNIRKVSQLGQTQNLGSAGADSAGRTVSMSAFFVRLYGGHAPPGLRFKIMTSTLNALIHRAMKFGDSS